MCLDVSDASVCLKTADALGAQCSWRMLTLADGFQTRTALGKETCFHKSSSPLKLKILDQWLYLDLHQNVPRSSFIEIHSVIFA